MELYKILKTRKGEKKSFKRVDYKAKKERGKEYKEGNEWKRIINIVAINSNISIITLNMNGRNAAIKETLRID